MGKYVIFILIMIFTMLLAGCKGPQVDMSEFSPFKIPVTLSTTAEEVEKKPWEYVITAEEEEEKITESVPDEFVYPKEHKKPEAALYRPAYTGEKIDIAFNFDDAEIKDVLHVILGEILNVNYILDNRVGGKINLHATGQVYKEELFSILNTLLYVYNFSLIKEGDIYRVLPKPDARQETNIVVSGDKIPPWSKDVIVQIVPLQYESPRNLNATLRPFMTNIGNIVIHGDSPYIILIETASNMEKLLTIIKTFDVPFFAGKAVKFYEFRYVDPKNVAKDLTTFVQLLGANAGKEGELNFIPFSDTNKMVVVSKSPELLSKIDLWMKNIDVPPPKLGEIPKIYVYKVQHQKAESIVAVLTQIYAEKIATQPKGPAEKEQVEPMKIVADTQTNTIVIKALPGDYRGIKAIIEAIDATPQQVFIEALILEVDLRDTLDYGSEWAIDAGTTEIFGLGDLLRTAGTPALTFKKGSFEILLEILATTSNVKILSAPHVLVRSEQPAYIQVGDEVPILTSAGQQTGTEVVFEQVQYRDTGIILTVTPYVAENDFITMDVKQEVSNAVETTTGVSRSPTFTTRQAETSLVIKSGHTISLGGIIDQQNDVSVNKIPILGDIPLLGNLFKTTSSRNKRVELIMLITPYIAKTAEEADMLTNAFQKKLKEIEPLLSRSIDAFENY